MEQAIHIKCMTGPEKENYEEFKDWDCLDCLDDYDSDYDSDEEAKAVPIVVNAPVIPPRPASVD